MRKASWAQPSLSRDFAILSVAIVFLLLMMSAWVTWITYGRHSDTIIQELDKEAGRIDRSLQREIESAAFLLSALGQKVVRIPHENKQEIAELIRPFESRPQVYALWSWADVTEHVVVSSNKGVLDKPVNVSDRDYIRHSQSEPWVPHIGKPVEGRVSGRWIIPIGMGITDTTGRYLGTLAVSIDVQLLTDQISQLIRREGVSFSIMSKSFVPLTEQTNRSMPFSELVSNVKLSNLDIEKNKDGVISKAGLFSNDKVYAYYHVADKYPYVILVAYDTDTNVDAIRSLLWPRLIQMVAAAMFLVLFLWIIRMRIIKPVVDLTGAAAQVARGEPYHNIYKTGPVEIENLALQIRRVSDYIAERKRLEEELREKIAQLKSGKQ